MRAYLAEPEAVREVNIERRSNCKSLRHTTRLVSRLAVQRCLRATQKEVEDEDQGDDRKPYLHSREGRSTVSVTSLHPHTNTRRPTHIVHDLNPRQ